LVEIIVADDATDCSLPNVKFEIILFDWSAQKIRLLLRRQIHKGSCFFEDVSQQLRCGVSDFRFIPLSKVNDKVQES
jgi:hypothetical protein